jgi:hypothetical protein
MEENQSKPIYPEQLIELISRYGFDLEGQSPEFWIAQYRQDYPVEWIYLAIMEALHQGRYKIISIEQILRLWLKRGSSVYHFGEDFEFLINRTVPGESVSSISSMFIDSPSWPITLDEDHSVDTYNDNLRISEFIPLVDASNFYQRLKALVEA